MKIKIEIRNKDLDLVDVKEYEFQEYFDYLSRRTASILYLIEAYKSDFMDFDTLRNSVLDLAGHIKRVPDGISFLNEE